VRTVNVLKTVSLSVEVLAFLQCCAALLASLYRRVGTTYRSHQQESGSPYYGPQNTMTKTLPALNIETEVLRCRTQDPGRMNAIDSYLMCLPI
jgi:hypothetical protein